MTTTVPVNGRRLRAALEDHLIAERTFARSLNLGERTLRTMLNDNKMFGSLTISKAAKVADAAGLTLLKLLTPDDTTVDTQPEPGDIADADERVLNQLLRAAPARHLEHNVAIALGWSLDRLRAAAASLNARLHPLGEQVHANEMGIKMLPLDEGAVHATEHLLTLHDSDKGLDANTARMLYAIYSGTHSAKRVSKTNYKHLQALINRGLLQRVDEPGNRTQLAEDVHFAFEP